MKICYIPATTTMLTVASSNTLLAKTATAKEMGWVEEQVYNALSGFWGDLCTWANQTWINFIDASFVMCLAVAFTGAICGICGIKKGWKVTVFSIIFYLLLRFFSWAMGWY